MSRIVQVRVKGAAGKKLGEIHNVHLGDNDAVDDAIPSLLAAWPELDAKHVELVDEEETD